MCEYVEYYVSFDALAGFDHIVAATKSSTTNVLKEISNSTESTQHFIIT